MKRMKFTLFHYSGISLKNTFRQLLSYSPKPRPPRPQTLWVLGAPPTASLGLYHQQPEAGKLCDSGSQTYHKAPGQSQF